MHMHIHRDADLFFLLLFLGLVDTYVGQEGGGERGGIDIEEATSQCAKAKGSPGGGQ
jgi:hypothetical protein